MTESEYSINFNDLKYKKYRKLDPTKITTFRKSNKDYNEKLEKIYLNTNLDTIKYRLKECIKNGKKILDLKYLELKMFPDLDSDIIENLEELYIGNNELESLPDLNHFKNLLVLDISINKINKLKKMPKKLIEFTCFDNKIEDISNISVCANLKTLFISNNLITSLDFLNNHQNLEILMANNNKISDIPQNIIKIRKIHIRNNNITKIKSYNNLIYLDCQNNNLEYIAPMNNLRDLILSDNTQIEDIPVFKSLKYLEILNTNISKIKYMNKLEELICIKDCVKYISSKYKLDYSSIHKDKYLNLFFIPN
jgi:Leucine-rich repeat (LRR) protein